MVRSATFSHNDTAETEKLLLFLQHLNLHKYVKLPCIVLFTKE